MARKRRRGLLIGVGIATMAFLGIGVAVAAGPRDQKPRPEPEPGRDADLDPLDPDPDSVGMRKRIDQAVCDCLDRGAEGENEVTLCVVERIWKGVPWPPIPADHESHGRAWLRVLARVRSWIQAALAGKGEEWCEAARFQPGIRTPEEEPDVVITPVPTGLPKGVDLGPWESPTGYPRDGIMHQVRKGSIFLGTDSNMSIVYRTLLSAGYLAAKAHGASDDEATAFAQEVAGSGPRRIQYLELIECSPYNDALSATWGYAVGAKYGQEHVAPTGRVIRLVKYHPDNRKRIQQGLPPMRNIELGTPDWPRQDPPREAFWQWDEAKQAFEYLWLPKLDYDALWNELRIAVDPEPWEGAVDEEVLRSKIFPPPVITNLGLANVPTGMTWGCPGLPLLDS